MSRPTNVGYEKYRFDYSQLPDNDLPMRYQAARIKNGRITERSRLFDTEAEADEWIEAQRVLDEDDYQRERGA
jgi:hypothetical protein